MSGVKHWCSRDRAIHLLPVAEARLVYLAPCVIMFLLISIVHREIISSRVY